MDQRRSAIKEWLKRVGWATIGFVGLLIIIPIPNSESSCSTVLLASDGQLMGAHIADDGQWRFPLPDSIPSNVETAIRLFEDEYFYRHPGVNPVSIYRAIRQNIRAGKVVSGGSTITMQLARILKGNRSRTLWNKLIELFVVFQLELKYSKKSIINQYVGLAPFGGNVVGVDAAAWRYYGRSAHLLSWSEAATLAVLPNAPSLIYPGKGHVLLEKKRNRLLLKLYNKRIIDRIEYELSKEEPLPHKPYPLPNLARHLVQDAMKKGSKGKRIKSTINYALQRQHLDIASRYHNLYHDNEIHNLAILTVDVETGEIISYVGNSDCKNEAEGTSVDVIHAPRSSGSILKPLLYAAAFDDGLVAPESLVPDIPTRIAGYTPKNFDRSYSGAVKCSDALTRSLNIPAVRLLQSYGLPRFHEMLQELNFTTIDKSADHYGLSLILGGAEVSLYDLVNAYRGVSKSLKTFVESASQYDRSDYDRIHYQVVAQSRRLLSDKTIIDAGSIWQMLEVLSNVERPRAEAGWRSFANGRQIAWKTGTSFGHRDAWAIGMNGSHVVGVWVGNADGEGRPGLTGLNFAGPVLFDVFNSLESGDWYSMPYDDMEGLAICPQSGYRIGIGCVDTAMIALPISLSALATCDYHETVTTDMDGQYRVDRSCHQPSEIIQRSYFKLPAVQAYYYRKHSTDYVPIPPLKSGCQSKVSVALDIIYPFDNADVSIPIDLNGERQRIVFSAAHTDPLATLHWHLDDQFIQATRGNHEISFAPPMGKHILFVIDQDGVEMRRRFEVVD